MSGCVLAESIRNAWKHRTFVNKIHVLSWTRSTYFREQDPPYFRGQDPPYFREQDPPYFREQDPRAKRTFHHAICRIGDGSSAITPTRGNSRRASWPCMAGGLGLTPTLYTPTVQNSRTALVRVVNRTKSYRLPSSGFSTAHHYLHYKTHV